MKQWNWWVSLPAQKIHMNFVNISRRIDKHCSHCKERRTSGPEHSMFHFLDPHRLTMHEKFCLQEFAFSWILATSHATQPPLLYLDFQQNYNGWIPVYWLTDIYKLNEWIDFRIIHLIWNWEKVEILLEIHKIFILVGSAASWFLILRIKASNHSDETIANR